MTVPDQPPATGRTTASLKPDSLQQAILSSASFPIIATDEKGVIQLFNVGAERLLGYRASEVINRIDPGEIHDPEEALVRAQALSREYQTEIAPGFQSLAYKASRGIEDIYELTYVCKDGTRFPAIVSITALRNEQQQIIGYLLIGSDNSIRKKIEAELEAARIVAERASLAKSEFLSSMSHELRTPLGAILGFAQLLESGQPPPTSSQERSIDQILKAGWYLLELINEVLDLAVVESGTLSLSLEPVSLFEVLYECHAIFEQHARKRSIRVFYPKFVTAHFVRADRMRLKQVLINLLSNAIKYNRQGGAVVLSCSVIEPARIRINIEDTGAGLSAEQLGQLFQPFNRLGKETGTEEGTGIGLVLCKKLVEMMGGVVQVESTVGRGSVFSIELELTDEQPPLPDSPDYTVLPIADASIEAAQCTLLYIEDNPADIMLVEVLVARKTGISLLTANDGICGIEIARAYRPDLILMNINRPGISGDKALKALAEDPITENIPVIALSANAMPRDIEKGLQAGFFRYITKPIKIEAFMDVLEVATRNQQTHETTSRSGGGSNDP